MGISDNLLYLGMMAANRLTERELKDIAQMRGVIGRCLDRPAMMPNYEWMERWKHRLP